MSTSVPSVDLRPDHWAIVHRALRCHVPDREVLAFGSRATWTAKDYSDLDLAVMGEEPLSLRTVSALDEALGESDLPFKVDVVDWARIDDDFRTIVVRHGVVVQSVAGSSKGRGVGHLSVHRAEGWRAARLGEVVRFLSGGTPSKKCAAYWNGEIPWVSAKEMKQFRLCDTTAKVTVKALANGAKRVPAGTVLLLTRGMRLLKEVPVCVVQQPMTFNQDIKALESKPDIDPSFLPYLLLGNTERLRNLVDLAGHGTGRINTDELGGLDVSLPPLRQQRAIAHVLGTLDDKIELNRRMNETLEATARALFKSWFVDFDPVLAKMEGRDTGLPHDIAGLFPDRLVDSEMGEIPEGWRGAPLDGIARFQNGLALQKFRPALNEARLPVVKIAQLRAGEANSGEWASAAIRPECIVEDGDVLFSWSGSLLVKTWCGGRAALNQHLFKVTSPKYPKWFYLHSLLSHLRAFRRIARDKATTMGHIRRHHLTEALCAAPPDDVIARLSGTFSCLLRRRIANELSGRTLAALRDTLLPKLISGEIRLGETAWTLGMTDR